jgi:16S rRNA (guanine(966)-N(2))-methyltransferase RsmD
MTRLRITGGFLKGRMIEVPKGRLAIRPAMEKMRESVFSILGNLEDAAFLDLFSGSGCIGIEAASRGAKPVVCIESDRRKIPVLQKNISIVNNNINYFCKSVELYIKCCKEKFSVIFCDPPFPYAYKSDLLASISHAEMLTENGCLLIHYPQKESLEKQYESLVLTDERQYGGSAVRFYTNG